MIVRDKYYNTIDREATIKSIGEKIDSKKILMLVLIAVLAIFGIATIRGLVTSVKAGSYQVKQAAVSGTLSAKMDPGIH